MNRWLHEFVSDETVAAIKTGRPNALYVWGALTYRDEFDDPHTTKFCMWYVWRQDGKVSVYYTQRHQEAD